MHSLRRRLLAWVLPTSIAAAAVASAATYWGAANELASLLDGQLEYLANHVRVDGAQVRIERSNTYADRLNDDRIDAVVLQVWRGAQLEFTDDAATRLPAPARTGFSDVVLAGQKWHTFALRRGDTIVQVAQVQDARWEALARVAVHLVWPLVASAAALALALWFGIGQALRPVRRLAGELRERDADRLRPVSAAGVPAEVQPLLTALNEMLLRLERAFAAQKRFVADAAHELRTPVMALSVQAQLADTAADERERLTAVRDLRAGAERLSRLTQQLLDVARLEPNPASAPQEEIALVDMAREVVLDHADAAQRKQIDLGLCAQDPVMVRGVGEHVAMLLRNLVDNAIRYTPPGGRVDVGVRAGPPGRSILEVNDDGPGIPAAERAHVFERFRRGAGQRETGSGLGLAIVRRIAEEHGAAIEVAQGLGERGTCIRVAFPSARGVRPDTCPQSHGAATDPAAAEPVRFT